MNELKSNKFDPVKEFVALRDNLATTLSQTLKLQNSRTHFPTVDIFYDADKNLVVRTQPIADLDPDSLEIVLEDNILTISGAISESADANVSYLLRENPTGQFSRSMSLEVDVSACKVEAHVNKARIIHIKFVNDSLLG